MSNSTFGYVEAPPTAVMRGLPRFGHTATFAYLFGTQEQQQDYLYGLLFGGCLVLSFFFVWFLLIVIFKCCCKRSRTGFLRGNAMKVQMGSKRPRRVRITFVISTVIVIAFSVTLVTKGLTQLTEGANSVYDSALQLGKILQGVEDFVEELITIATEATPLRDVLMARLADDFCSENNTGTLANETGVDYNALIQDSSSQLNGLGNFTETDIEQLQEAMGEMKKANENAEGWSEDSISVSDWQSLLFLIPFPLFCTIFLTGVLMASHDKSNKCFLWLLAWVVFPLFFLLVLFCCVMAGLMLIGASANADFCSGGEDNTPESSIREILEVNGFNESDLVFRAVSFYISTCDAASRGNPFTFLEEYEDNSASGARALSTFGDSIRNTTIDRFIEICGKEDIQDIEVIMNALEKRIDLLVAAVIKALETLSCASLIPIYTNAFHDGTCQYTVTGFSWTFASFLVIGVAGMTMATLRAAYRPTKYVANYDDKFNSIQLDTVADEAEYQPYNQRTSSKNQSFRDDEGSTTYSRDDDSFRDEFG